MRPALFVSLFIVVLPACESDLTLSPATVEWMEWPAEVPVATPFTVRLLVGRPGCVQGEFRPGSSADQSAVTFAPYFLIKKGTDAICLPVAQQVDIYYGALDTVGIAPGLPADFARTFEMRAAAAVYAAPATAVADLPVRTYGEVTVRLTDPNTTVRNAGGFASKFVDNLGCVRVKPSGLYGPGASYALEDQADTASFRYAFVRGYIHSVTTPVCGEARVFELLSRN